MIFFYKFQKKWIGVFPLFSVFLSILSTCSVVPANRKITVSFFLQRLNPLTYLCWKRRFFAFAYLCIIMVAIIYLLEDFISLTHFCGGQIICSTRSFIVESFFADRRFGRTDLREVSLESLQSVEYQLKRSFWIFCFTRSYRRVSFPVSVVFIAYFVNALKTNKTSINFDLISLKTSI